MRRPLTGVFQLRLAWEVFDGFQMAGEVDGLGLHQRVIVQLCWSIPTR